MFGQKMLMELDHSLQELMEAPQYLVSLWLLAVAVAVLTASTTVKSE
jgi:hypothetical protein